MLPGVSRKFPVLGNCFFPRFSVALYFPRSRKHFSETLEIFRVLGKKNKPLIRPLTHGIPPAFRGGVHLFEPPYAIKSVPCLSGRAIAYRCHSPPRVHQHSAGCPQGSSSNGCCLCITMDQIMCASLFPRSLLLRSGHVESVGGSTNPLPKA